MSPIKLVLADVDGTLVTHEKVLTPRAIASVQALGRAGIAFAVTSGRPPRGMQMFVEPLSLTTPLAAFNGGRFVRPDLSLIAQRVLARDAVEVVVPLGKMLGIEAGAVATIGDMPNDNAMFEKSGLSIAMGQSSDEVKRAATHVTTSSEEEGFANATNRFILGQL